MRPDRAVVVRERVVARVAARHRAHAPARPELLAHQLVDDRVDALPGHDPAPEQVADVRAERVDLPLLAVEREHVVAAARVGPEAPRRRCASAPRPRARAARRAAGRARPRARARPCAASRRRRSPAPRHGAIGVCASEPSWKRCESPRVLPRLVLEPARGAPLVLDEAVAVAVAVLVDPAQRRHGRLLQLRARRPRRRSSARPPTAARGRAASRRPCRSRCGTTSGRPCRSAARGRSCPARRRRPGRRRAPAARPAPRAPCARARGRRAASAGT